MSDEWSRQRARRVCAVLAMLVPNLGFTRYGTFPVHPSLPFFLHRSERKCLLVPASL